MTINITSRISPAVCDGRVPSRGRDDIGAVCATHTACHTILSIWLDLLLLTLGVWEKKRREKHNCASFSPGNPVLRLRFPSTQSPDHLDERHDGIQRLYAMLTYWYYICIHVLLIEAAGFGCLVLERCSILTSSFLFSCKPAVMLQVAQARVLCIFAPFSPHGTSWIGTCSLFCLSYGLGLHDNCMLPRSKQ